MSKYKCKMQCIYGCTVETIGVKPAPERCLYTGEKMPWTPVEGVVEKAMKETQDKLVDKIVKHPYALPKQPATGCSQLPKLTVEVFDRPDCPEWAEYAAVDADGAVWGFAIEPYFDEENRCWVCHTDDYEGSSFIAEGFDASDWKNSLIKRVKPTTDGKLVIRFKKLHPDAKAPYQATPGSAGWDLTATSVEPIKGNWWLNKYGTGLAVEIPKGYVGLVFPRSSVYKTLTGLTNCVGVIDSDYRGEISAVFTSGAKCNDYKVGDRIAQLVIMPIPAVKFVEAEELTETQRGAGGYGSTGK